MTLETVLVLFAIAVVAVVLFKVFGKKKQVSSKPKHRAENSENLANLEIQNARIGDTLVLSGAGENFDDLTFSVDRKYRYEADGFSWYELSGKHRGKRVNLEWSEDDELEVFLNTRKGIKLAHLNLTAKDLQKMDNEESNTGSIDFEGKQWSLESCQEALYFRDDADDGEKFKVWDFSSEDQEQRLYVEKWEGDPYEAGLAQRIEPSTITIFRS
ncbi:MAG: DUF4178 domain-containing protein [Proteobacteria bacterium]|nr:DUF4178 domain-containing protein [Pseudomonadota bacterium]